MATKREVADLADLVATNLKLDPGEQLLDMEELVSKATPKELETLRKQVMQKQSLSGFDDEGLIKRFVHATKPKGCDSGAGDNNQSYFNCFQNQIMMPTVVDQKDQLPEDLCEEWLCTVCPEGNRVLVIASHRSTRVYDLEGTWICEHDTHLPGGSLNDVSKMENDTECTILDCLYNNENEIYYVVDLLCWKGLSYYKYETSVRMTTLTEKVKNVPTLKQVSHTNPFRFYTLPLAENSTKRALSIAVAQARFEITGLLFYHKRALYLPGLSPLGVWVETSYVPEVLDIPAQKLEYNKDQVQGKRDWRKNRYEISSGEFPGSRRLIPPGKQRKNRNQRGNQDNSFSGEMGGQYETYPNYAQNPYYPVYGNYAPGYGGYGGYNMNYIQQQPQQFYQQQQQHNYQQGQEKGRKGNQRPRKSSSSLS